MQIQGETSVNKLILLFVFDKMESALSERVIVEMCTARNNWLNYMDCMELLPKLLDDGFICRISSSEEEPLYTITSDGRESLSSFYITIPKSVTNIGPNAFTDCSGLKDNDGYIIVNGVLYNYCGKNTNIIIPDGVVEISDRVFCGRKINSLTIPSSVTKLGKYVFLDCQSFKKLIILGNITSIDTGAFKNGLPRYIYAKNMSIEYIKSQKLMLPAAMGFLLHTKEFTNETVRSEYVNCVLTQKRKLLPLILEDDLVEGIIVYANTGKITTKNFEEEFLLPAQAANAIQCVAYLLEWKENNIPFEAE